MQIKQKIIFYREEILQQKTFYYLAEQLSQNFKKSRPFDSGDKLSLTECVYERNAEKDRMYV